MKIALVRPRVGFGLGGAENYTAYVARELSRLGHEVTVVADRCEVPGVRLLRAPVVGRGSLAKTLSFFFNARRVLRQESFDLVYATGRFFPADWLRISDPLHLVWLRRGYARPPFLWPLRPRHRLLLWLEVQSLRAARRVIVNSRLVAREIAEFYPFASPKTEVIYNGVDLARFNPSVQRFRAEVRGELSLSEKDRALLFVGSDWRRKGLPFLLEVLEELPPEFKLLVAGGKPLGQKGRVYYLGPVREMERLYGAADLLTLPTRYDPFANVVLEALACGLPVITTPENGAAEVIPEGWGRVLPREAGKWKTELERVLEEKGGTISSQDWASWSWENHLRRLLG
ncbi:glycosyltransferase family 4 protein [Thermosulfurimonas marina]|uniref:Glycosyltransferase family 4 protein n=1 Tax=Thermosulfurimonas marina TaxID=2047767 RepID=A0A6H1WST5_9BACT|nr:glycosyltransferase family 4 protein [Thermosulfurimonas marina]QJA06285.1 glycosyltransferase family 4 protein [Thermosulfurimonas marina]